MERIVALHPLQVLVERGVEAIGVDAEGLVWVERAPGLLPIIDVLEGAVDESVERWVGSVGHGRWGTAGRIVTGTNVGLDRRRCSGKWKSG
jgi:hypothetical protein